MWYGTKIFLMALALVFVDFHVSMCTSLAKEDGVVTSSEAWRIRRRQILRDMEEVMGRMPNPSRKVSLDMEILEEVEYPSYLLRNIRFSVEKEDRLPAFLLIPRQGFGPWPAMLCLHQTLQEGKAEPAGLAGHENLHYGKELAKRGYVVLAPDYPNFGEYFMDPYVQGYASATMKGIWNHSRAIDLLESLEEVDPLRIGCIGHSLGGHNSLFLAAFDERVRAVVTSCGFTSFPKYYQGDLTGWSHKGYMPRVASDFDKDPSKIPFDFSDILCSLAPRPLFIHAPVHDSNFDVSGVKDCVKAAQAVYDLHGKPVHLVAIYPDGGHDFSPEGRSEAYAFLDRHLRGSDTLKPLVGVSYFAGWWEELPNKWHDGSGKDWRPSFSERIPLLGQHNTQETMDREIVAAAEHGVDFFIILWYYQPEGVEKEPHARHLERGVLNFIRSSQAHRMRFMIEFCNHPPFEVETEVDWEICIAKWIEWMKHPSYLKVRGKPVFKVHGFHHFMKQVNMSPEMASSRLGRLREAVRDAGLGELMLGCGVGGHEPVGHGHPAVELFDFTGTYMDLPAKEQREADYPYMELIDFARTSWKQHGEDAIPWMPYLPAGWSPGPGRIHGPISPCRTNRIGASRSNRCGSR